MKTLFGLWPWRTQASSSGKNSDYPLLMNNGYETTCDKQEQLKQHQIQANWFESADSKGQTVKVPLSAKSRIMPALLRLDSTGEISSVDHHIEKNWVDVNKCQTKPRTLRSFVAPKMSLNKNFASPVYHHNFSMSFPGQVYNSKNPSFPLSSTNSWYTNNSLSPGLKSHTALRSLSKSKSFPTVKEFSTSLDYVPPKIENVNNTGQMFGNNPLLAALTSQAYKMAFKEDTSKANLQHLWKSYFSQPATQLSQAAFSDSTVDQQLCDISSAIIPSSDTMTFNSLLVPSHNTVEPESIDFFKSQEHQKSESLLNSEEQESKLSSKCSRGKKDNDSLDINNPSMNIELSNNINHSAGIVSPSVLNTPRKVVKKGRPSSKKQRKRQRQKQKHACRSSPKDETSSLIENLSEGCLDRSSSFDIVFTSDESPNVQVCESKAPRASTPIKAPSRHSERDSCVMFTLESDSDESDIEFDGCDWLGEENSKVPVSPKDDAVFNVTSLDTIFKQTSIPSLKSVLTTDEGRSESESSTPLLSPAPDKAKNGLCFNLINVSFSEDDSTQEVNAICDPSLSSSPLEKCFFQLSSGLCLDRLFPSNSRSSNLAPEVVSLDQADCAQLPCPSSFITEINSKWNLSYPSAGFRSCQSICKDQVDDPSIKVHFAAEPHLLTVHVVGTEDRYGTWQLYALDRDRFHRRIQDAKKVICPVLEQQHRAKIMERNSQLLTNSEKRELNNN